VAVCAAFHGAIPAEILANEVDHRKPRIDPETGKPGDEGVLLAGSITFAFDDAITSAARETLTHYLDGLGA
jgi:hypothetical protein